MPRSTISSSRRSDGQPPPYQPSCSELRSSSTARVPSNEPAYHPGRPHSAPSCCCFRSSLARCGDIQALLRGVVVRPAPGWDHHCQDRQGESEVFLDPLHFKRGRSWEGSPLSQPGWQPRLTGAVCTWCPIAAKRSAPRGKLELYFLVLAALWLTRKCLGFFVANSPCSTRRLGRSPRRALASTSPTRRPPNTTS